VKNARVTVSVADLVNSKMKGKHRAVDPVNEEEESCVLSIHRRVIHTDTLLQTTRVSGYSTIRHDPTIIRSHDSIDTLPTPFPPLFPPHSNHQDPQRSHSSPVQRSSHPPSRSNGSEPQTGSREGRICGNRTWEYEWEGNDGWERGNYAEGEEEGGRER
jgi:hypothetical protein